MAGEVIKKGGGCGDDGGRTTPTTSEEVLVLVDCVEGLAPIDPSPLNHLAKNMFQKTSDYLQGELVLVQEDYRLLENLNRATAAKYSDMRQISANVGNSLHQLNDKYKSLEPLLLQIDQIEDSVNKLEQAAYKLDSYSKRLETKFKSLEKRQ